MMMFNLFKKKKEIQETEDNEDINYDPSTVKVSYEGEVISPEYADRTLVYVNGKLRDEFNNQDYSFTIFYHMEKEKLNILQPN